MRNKLRKIGLVLLSIALSFTLILTVAAVSSLSYSPDSNGVVNLKSENAVNEYIDSIYRKNEQLAKGKIENMKSTITFSKAMNAAELEEYVNSYNLDSVQIQARGYDEEGNRITIFSDTYKGFDETFEIMQKMANESDVELAGAISIYAYVDSEYLTEIQDDTDTLLVDTSSDSHFEDSNNISTYILNAFSSDNDDGENGFTHSVAWDAEDLGLVYYEIAQ